MTFAVEVSQLLSTTPCLCKGLMNRVAFGALTNDTKVETTGHF